MGTLIQIRGVDERTRDELAARAERRGQSLTAFLRTLLDKEAARPDLADLFAEIDARHEPSVPTSVDFLREGRDTWS